MDIIKQHLLDNNISLRELSRRSGVSAGHLSNIVNDKTPVTARNARKLARAMGLRAWYKLVTE